MAEIQSLARGLHILNLLSLSPDGASITEISEALSVDKASASRLVATLVKYGFAEKDEVTRRNHLGPQVVALSRSLLTRMPLRDGAKPFLRQLMERTGECAHLAVATQGKALYIDQVESPATLRVNAQVGTMNPLHCTALGKILLAFGAAPIPDRLEAYTFRTITDTVILEHELEKIRHQGYALDDEEFETGIRCIAVPAMDFRGKLVGSMGISGPSSRMTRERLPNLIKIVVEVGQALSERLSFTQS